MGALDKAVKRILELNGDPGEIQPGEVFVTNDPYYGGVTHLSEPRLMSPTTDTTASEQPPEASTLPIRLPRAWQVNGKYSRDPGGIAGVGAERTGGSE